ncbi:MAG: transglutaminase-like domain-containing protein, partial [Candidatus Poribacteria bacterium]|nr:transglutaminase-like domain-containing protein [Candidatus Poribacteria bacterium]
IEEKVQLLTKNLETDEAKISAIYNFIASEIRYVGIELGQSAYQPSYATEVFQMQYGDCKDKTTLLISMLDLAGIKAYPCLISMAPYARVDTTLPFLSQFNHIIAAVPTGADTYIWLDTTAATCSYGDLPYNVQGRTGFLISDTHGIFVETPIFSPEANRLVSTTELTLDSEGTAQGTLHIQTSGQYSLNTRWTYQQVHPSAMKTTLATELSRQFPGIQIEWWRMSDPGDLNNVPVEIHLGFQVRNYARPSGNSMLLPLPIDEFAAYAETFANEHRTYSLDFGYPMQIEKIISIQIPEGWTAVLPEDVHQTIEIAELRRQYRQVENVITYRLVFTLKNRILRADAYTAAKSLFVLLASEDGSRLLLNSRQPSTVSRQRELGLEDQRAGRARTQPSSVLSKF